MSEIIKRKYAKGKLVKETREHIDWEPNEADLDLVDVKCDCGNKFDMPWDAIAFGGFEGMYCGQCGETGKFEVVK